ncbi:hypothetical protein AAIJ07_33490, partial [Pseudomonas aeruginosa]|uniref:hypothetical protein n=1 Tax=Pseudomonas aeruginosa TaxID=287 RepID=UPI0031B6F8B2
MQYFSQGEGKISADIMTSAVVISSWYTDEYKKLFALPDESELQLQDARELSALREELSTLDRGAGRHA